MANYKPVLDLSRTKKTTTDKGVEESQKYTEISSSDSAHPAVFCPRLGFDCSLALSSWQKPAHGCTCMCSTWTLHQGLKQRPLRLKS